MASCEAERAAHRADTIAEARAHGGKPRGGGESAGTAETAYFKPVSKKQLWVSLIRSLGILISLSELLPP